MSPLEELEEYDDLVEAVAKLEHKQWVHWSKSLAKDEKISKERLERWEKLWCSYSRLPEAQKEQDRIWAKKVLKVILNTLQ